MSQDRLALRPSVRVQQLLNASRTIFPDNDILAQLATTQALLESGTGIRVSALARKHNNIFGIKGRGTAGTAWVMTNEFVKGKMIRVKQGFRKNLTLSDSFDDYKNLIINKPRYHRVKVATTFEDAAFQVRRAGYATDPKYTEKLLKVHKKYIAPLL